VRKFTRGTSITIRKKSFRRAPRLVEKSTKPGKEKGMGDKTEETFTPGWELQEREEKNNGGL